jgi:hypothetical protein
LYNLPANTLLTNGYADTIWQFTPKLYVALRDKIYTLIELGPANTITDSSRTFVRAVKLKGLVPVIDLVSADSTHNIITEKDTRFTIASNIHTKIDALYNYPFEDNLLIRLLPDSTPTSPTYDIANLNTGTRNTLTRLSARTELFPLYGNIFRLRVSKSKNYIYDLVSNSKYSLRDNGNSSVFKIMDSINDMQMFFVCHNSGDTTITYLLKTPVAKKDLVLLAIDTSIFTGDRFAGFENNMLRVRHNRSPAKGLMAGN